MKTPERERRIRLTTITERSRFGESREEKEGMEGEIDILCFREQKIARADYQDNTQFRSDFIS